MAGELAALDQALARVGQTIVLRNAAGDTVTVSAVVRGYVPEELVGSITQQDSKVIMSPTEIIAAGWASGRAAPADSRVPMVGNSVLINGQMRRIQAAAGIYVVDELVRIELSVKG